MAGGDVRSCIVACIDILTYVRMDMGEGVLVCWSAILLCQARSTSSRGEMSLEVAPAGWELMAAAQLRLELKGGSR